MDETTTVFGSAIPLELRNRNQWVCWRSWEGKKLPTQPNGKAASSTNKETWSSYAVCAQASDTIGFVFSADDPFIGIDLDGCRDPQTRLIQPWAWDVIEKFATYAEISPSGTGVKLWGIFHGLWTCPHKKAFDGSHCGIEVYQTGRYFCVTGKVIAGYEDIVDITAKVPWFVDKFELSPSIVQPTHVSHVSIESPLIERAAKYIAKMPGAISGQSGSNAAFSVACVLVKGFGLSEEQAFSLFMAEYNNRCVPPWSEPEVKHKIRSAMKQAGQVGYLADSIPEQWANVTIPAYIDDTNELSKISERYGLEPAWTLRQLLEADLAEDYLIDQVLIENQPCMLAGAFKSLKTTIALDMALSICSGAKFLQRFDVLQKKRVLFCSAESGKKKIRKTMYALAELKHSDEKPISLAQLRDDDMIRLCWWVPKVSNIGIMKFFKAQIDAAKAGVVVIDPLYRSLDDQQASMILNGQQLGDLCEYVLKSGATPICCDHAKRSSENLKTRDPIELDDISGAGKAEYFRQWLLVNRREKFAPTISEKPHKLWLSIGGSEGHSSQWSLDVVERFDDSGHMEMEIETTDRAAAVETSQLQLKSKRDIQKEQKFEATLAKTLEFFRASPDEPRVKADIKDEMKCSNDTASALIHHLVQRQEIFQQADLVRRGNNSTVAWRLIKSITVDTVQAGQVGQKPASTACPSIGNQAGQAGQEL